MFKKDNTERGFGILEFDDLYGNASSIQISSLATERAIWFGINDADPQILRVHMGYPPSGWVKYPIPKEVLLTTRMHLNQEQVKQLIPVLQKFVDTGEI